MRLAGIANLKVVSPSFTLRYRSSKSHNLSEIAKQFSVANILEGSVQKSAGRLRVNVQLSTRNRLPALDRNLRPEGD